jgi:hypothetical protein
MSQAQYTIELQVTTSERLDGDSLVEGILDIIRQHTMPGQVVDARGILLQVDLDGLVLDYTDGLTDAQLYARQDVRY